MSIEELLEQPYWVVDILPKQVPAGDAGQYFAVDEYWRDPERMPGIRKRFTALLLKLNCYYHFEVFPGETEIPERDPLPERLAALAMGLDAAWCSIRLPSEDALITMDREDTSLTVYKPSPELLELLGALAAGEGLYVWKP